MNNSNKSSPDSSNRPIFSQNEKVVYLLSIDPGKSTGIALGVYSDSIPYTRTHYWQIENGIDGFCDWYEKHDGGMVDVIEHLVSLFGDDGGGRKRKIDFEKVVEKFILNPANPYAADLTPVEIEGALAAYGEKPYWQNRSDKSMVKDRMLRENDLWLTGKMVGCKDARDANDATIHALVHMMRKRHIPTIQHYFKGGE